ncbi:hypothetical protein [Halosolutus gelatinilyticus]|uniref:hypothetical protein n=1 Tax=Halosolutus gelatinilyticus TaxID=2931975 RepID=UPI001FF49699|nr:hypothetical protein [Halosolutus gelatinilyticus]
MSKRPIGTTTDDDRLHELRETAETAASTFAIDVSALADRMRARPGDPIDWAVDDDAREKFPMLVTSAIDERATGDAPHARRLREEGEAVVAPVPDPLLDADPPDGIGLDLDTYEPDRGLLFEAITTDETIGFVPVRFRDGEPFAAEPLPGVAEDSDPVAEETIRHESDRDPAPQAKTLDAPIDPDLLEETIAELDADRSTVTAALEAIERQELAGTGDHVADRPPLSVDDRAVCLLPDDAWTDRLAEELEAASVDLTDDALRAAREIHEREAMRLAEAAGKRDYYTPSTEYAAVVTAERETAEWEVSEPGTSR